MRWTLNQPQELNTIMQLEWIFKFIAFSHLLQLAKGLLKGK